MIHQEIINRIINKVIQKDIQKHPYLTSDDIEQMRSTLLEQFGSEMDKNIEIGIKNGHSPEVQELIVLSSCF